MTFSVLAFSLLCCQELFYEDRHYHEHCFRCFRCDRSLADEPFTSQDDALLCNDCYCNEFSSKCVACDKIVMPGMCGCCNVSVQRDFEDEMCITVFFLNFVCNSLQFLFFVSVWSMLPVAFRKVKLWGILKHEPSHKMKFNKIEKHCHKIWYLTNPLLLVPPFIFMYSTCFKLKS